MFIKPYKFLIEKRDICNLFMQRNIMQMGLSLLLCFVFSCKDKRRDRFCRPRSYELLRKTSLKVRTRIFRRMTVRRKIKVGFS